MNYQWKNSNGQMYLYAQADNHYELGVALGQGLKKQIEAAIKIFSFQMNKLENIPQAKEKIYAARKLYEKYITDEYFDEVKGICDGYRKVSNEDVSVSDIMLHSYAIDLLNQAEVLSQGDMSGCTNFGVINADGSVVHGQNYDSDPKLSVCDSFVHHKIKGEPEMFLYRFGGGLGMAAGKNETGTAMTVSVIKSNLKADIMTPRAVLLRNAMKKENAISVLKSMTDSQGRSPFSYNLVVSDSKTIAASQSTPFETRITQVKRTIVQSNQYDYIDWVKYLKKPSYSKKRQMYGENILKNMLDRYGYITNEDLLEILRDKPIICRTAVGDGIGTTVLFLTRESFGHGNAMDNPAGKIPF